MQADFLVTFVGFLGPVIDNCSGQNYQVTRPPPSAECLAAKTASQSRRLWLHWTSVNP